MTSKIVQQRLLEALETLERRIQRLRRAVRKFVRENGLLKARCAELEIRCAELEGLSTTDPLTQLPNLRDYEIRGVRLLTSVQWEWNSGSERTCFVVYLDIDNFKPVNDTLGHDFGDKVLKVLSRVLRSSTRRNDIIARLSGDEFVAILHQKELTEAIRFARRIASRFGEEVDVVIPRESSVAPSLSFGIHSFVNADLENGLSGLELLREITKKAEGALRLGKKTGKGNITISQPPC